MKKIIKSFILTLLILIPSGCFNYNEINNYAIVSGISIDLSEDKSKYEVGIQIMNAKKEEESNTSLITFYKSEGNTIYEALDKILLDSPKELYLGHNEVVVISETILKEKNPLDFLDYFMRDAEVEKDAFLMVSKNEKAYDILKVITPLETIPSKNLKSTLSIADEFSGTLTIVTMDEFIADLINDGRDPIIPAVTITGDKEEGDKMENIAESDPETKLKFNTIAFFEDNKLKDYLSDNESVGFNFLAGSAKRTYVNVKCDNDNYATIRVIEDSVKEKFSFKNSKPNVNVTATITANLLEYNCKADFVESDEYINDLQKKAEKKIKSLMKKAITKLYIENKADVLKYGEKFYQNKYKEMKSLKYTKENLIKDISFDFDVNVEIKSTELSIKSIKEASDNN